MLFLKILFLLLVYFDVRAQILPAEGYGTVIMYHRFDEDKYEDTSISSELFRSHLEFLNNEGYNVLPISKLVDFYTNEVVLPKKSVFITIDDGFKSFYDKAFPLLKKYQFPFTVFVSTDHVGKNNSSSFMTWDMLRELKLNGGTIHNHTSSHIDMNEVTIKEANNSVIKAQNSIKQELDFTSSVFSFPYGSSSIETEKLIKNLGFKISFGQQSSHAVKNENKFHLPRFAFNEQYGQMDRFKLIMKSFPLLSYEVSPKDKFLNLNTPYFGFSSDQPINDINCYHSSGLELKTQKILPNRVEVRFISKPNKGRNRINCTLFDKDGNLFWYGRILIYK